MTDGVLLIDEGPVTRLTLNRPELHNALSIELGDRVGEATQRASLDPAVKAIILKGAGRSFCAGDDIKEGGDYHDAGIEVSSIERHPHYQLMRTIRRIPKPVIAQVHGYRLRSAMDLVLAADFAVVAEDAQLGMVFGSRGIGPTGMVFLSRYLGLKQLNEVLLRAEPMSGVEAHQLGLVTEVAPPDEPEERTEALARRLLEGGQSLLVRAANRDQFDTLASLAGANIGVQTGTTGEIYAQENAPAGATPARRREGEATTENKGGRVGTSRRGASTRGRTP